MQRFTISGRLDGLNGMISANRRSRYDGAKAKREGTALCVWAIRAARIRKPERYPLTIWIHWTEPNGKRDPDNISGGGKKYILDALQIARIIPNDGQKQIRGFIDTFSVNRKTPSITVSIYEDGEPLPSVF